MSVTAGGPVSPRGHMILNSTVDFGWFVAFWEHKIFHVEIDWNGNIWRFITPSLLVSACFGSLVTSICNFWNYLRNECLFFSIHGKWIAVRNKQIAWTANITLQLLKLLKEWVSFFLDSWEMNRSAEQTNRTRTASRFTRFVCSAMRFISHEPRKKDTHSLYLQCFQQRPLLKFSEQSRNSNFPQKSGTWPYFQTRRFSLTPSAKIVLEVADDIADSSLTN